MISYQGTGGRRTPWVVTLHRLNRLNHRRPRLLLAPKPPEVCLKTELQSKIKNNLEIQLINLYFLSCCRYTRWSTHNAVWLCKPFERCSVRQEEDKDVEVEEEVSAFKMFSMRCCFMARLCCTRLLLEKLDNAAWCTVTATHGSAF